MIVKKYAAVAFMAAVMSGCGGEEDMPGVYNCDNEGRTGHVVVQGDIIKLELSHITPPRDKYDEILAVYSELLELELPKSTVYTHSHQDENEPRRNESFKGMVKTAKTYCNTGLIP